MSDLERMIFRASPLGVLAALALAVCATPAAFGAPGLVFIYLVPLAIIVCVLRIRTTVDLDAVTVRRIVGSKRVPWDHITSLRLGNKAKVSAVLTDGSELPLPAVRVRDLPALAAASGGRLPDPTPPDPAPAPASPPPAPGSDGEPQTQE